MLVANILYWESVVGAAILPMVIVALTISIFWRRKK